MEHQALRVQFRETKGKEAARRLRSQGLLPAVVYGLGEDPIPITLDPQLLTKMLRGGAGERALINLSIEGVSQGTLDTTVILKEKQLNPVKRTLLHVDLYRVAMDEAITVNIPIHVEGKAIGVEQGGVLEQPLRELEIRCLPGDIPDNVTVDVSAMDIGQSMHVRDLVVEKATILTDEDLSVVTVVPPTIYEEAVPEEEAELEGEELEAEGLGEEEPEEEEG
jgi:large subunit ribosomal protein L25